MRTFHLPLQAPQLSLLPSSIFFGTSLWPSLREVSAAVLRTATGIGTSQSSVRIPSPALFVMLLEPRTYAPNPRVLRGAAPNKCVYFGTHFERFACANCPNIVFTKPRISHLFASVGSSFISGAFIRPSRALDQALIR